MDFAITPTSRGETTWKVVCFREQRGGEVAVSVATFGYRGHAEAFLADLAAMVDAATRDVRMEEA